jgi:hypothetical protein
LEEVYGPGKGAKQLDDSYPKEGSGDIYRFPSSEVRKAEWGSPYDEWWENEAAIGRLEQSGATHTRTSWGRRHN